MKVIQKKQKSFGDSSFLLTISDDSSKSLVGLQQGVKKGGQNFLHLLEANLI
jgi:hypothetical protein